MNNKVADSTALGYACIFIASWITGLVDAGWFAPPVPYIGVVFLLFIGGILVPVSGVFSFINKDKIQGTLFVFLGGVYFSLAYYFMNANASNHMVPAYSGWVTLAFVIVFFYLWLAELKGDMFKQLFLLGLWLSILAFTIYYWTMVMTFNIIGGYLSLIIALLAAYISFKNLTAASEANT